MVGQQRAIRGTNTSAGSQHEHTQHVDLLIIGCGKAGKTLKHDADRNVERGFIQVVVDRKSQHVLGAILFCLGSQELINLVTPAMKQQLPFTVLRDAIHTHPSTSEALSAVFAEI